MTQAQEQISPGSLEKEQSVTVLRHEASALKVAVKCQGKLLGLKAKPVLGWLPPNGASVELGDSAQLEEG